MQYQFIMLTNTPYTRISEELTGYSRPDAEQSSPQRQIADSPNDRSTIVAVEAFNIINGNTYKWSMETFR